MHQGQGHLLATRLPLDAQLSHLSFQPCQMHSRVSTALWGFFKVLPRSHLRVHCEKWKLKAAISPSAVFNFYSNTVTGEAKYQLWYLVMRHSDLWIFSWTKNHQKTFFLFPIPCETILEKMCPLIFLNMSICSKHNKFFFQRQGIPPASQASL